MRFRSTLILAVVFLGLGAYLYFVEFERAEQEAKPKRLFTFAADDAVKVALKFPDREIVAQKTDGTWRLTAPLEAAADETTVKNLLRAVAECEVKKTLDDVPESLAPFGLDVPKVTVTVALKDRELPAIKVGKTSPIGNSTYIQRADEPKVYLTNSAFQSAMDKKVKDLRDKRILDFNDDDVRRIALERGDQATVLVKSDGTWRIEQPAAHAADPAVVRNFLASLRALRATDFPSEDAADLKPYGLDAPRLTVALSIGADNAETRLLVGKEGEDKSISVKVGHRPTVFSVGEWSYRDLNKTANDFRDKTVLAFDQAAVSEIELAPAEGEPTVLVRGEGGAWSVRGADGTADAERVEQLLTGLAGLKGWEIVTDAPADLGEYGLATPQLTITLRGADAAPLGSVRFGSHTPSPPATEYTAQRDGLATVFHVREFQFTQLNKQRADFLPPPPAAPAPAAGAPAAATPPS